MTAENSDPPLDEEPEPINVDEDVREIGDLAADERLRRVLAMLTSLPTLGRGLAIAPRVLSAEQMERLVVPSLDDNASFIRWWMEIYVPRIGVPRCVEILERDAPSRALDLGKVLYWLPEHVDPANEADVAALRRLRELARGA